jgi:hypothetical protein
METLLAIIRVLQWLLAVGLAGLLICWVLEYKSIGR